MSQDEPARPPRGAHDRGWPVVPLAATGLASLAVGAVLAGANYALRSLTGVPPADPRPSIGFTPWELGLPFEEASIPAADGTPLHAWLLTRPTSRRVVVGLTGYRGRRADLLGIGAALWRANYQVLLFDYRGHGDSAGRRVTLGYDEASDFRAVLDWLRWRLPDAWLGAIGYSMGGAVAILGAATDPAVRAVVTDCAFCRQEEIVRLAWRRRMRLPSAPVIDLVGQLLPRLHGYGFQDVEPLAVVDRLAPRPLLIIHAGADTIVPVADAHRLYAAAGAPKALWIVPDQQHVAAYFADRLTYCARVVRFFNEAAERDASSS